MAEREGWEGKHRKGPEEGIKALKEKEIPDKH